MRLAQLSYDVTASDLSASETDRAKDTGITRKINLRVHQDSV